MEKKLKRFYNRVGGYTSSVWENRKRFRKEKVLNTERKQKKGVRVKKEDFGKIIDAESIIISPRDLE